MRFTAVPALFLIIASCVTPATTPIAPVAATPAATPCRSGDALINAALWMQTAAEYRASALQAYALATHQLDAALADPTWTAIPGSPSTGLPPAVILDADETSLDNSVFEARMVRQGIKYDDTQWKAWIFESAATAIPGAMEFLEYAKSKGVTAFYLTNRRPDEEAPTRLNMEKLGFPLSSSEDTVLVRADRPEWDTGDKTTRRAHVAARYRVLLVLGDDLNDFVAARSLSVPARDTIMRDTAAQWGNRWIILPNALYGSWEEAAAGRGDDCEQLKKKIDVLRP